MRVKCNIVYPLLVEIPDNIRTNDDLLKHFYSLNILSKYIKQEKMNKNKKKTNMTENNKNILFDSESWQERINKEIEIYMQNLDEEALLEIKSNYVIRNKIRYWKKVLVLKNGKKYWLSNHIFMNSIKPFKELMIDLTGIEFDSKNNLPTQNGLQNSLQNDSLIVSQKEIDSQVQDTLSSVSTFTSVSASASASVGGSQTKDKTQVKDMNNTSLDNLVSNAFGFNF